MDQLGATIIYRLPPSGTEGPILSTRASEFESLCGMDLLISDLRDVTQTVRVTACSGKEQNAGKKVPMEDAQVDKSRSASSSGARSISVHAWRPLFPFLPLSLPCFTVPLTWVKPPCQVNSNHVFGSQHLVHKVQTNRLRSVVNKDSQNAHARKRSSQGSRRVFLGKRQDHLLRRNARHEGRFSIQWVGEIDEIRGQRKVRNVSGTSHRWEKTMPFLKNLSKSARGPIVHHGKPGALRSPLCDRALPNRACEERGIHQTSRAGTRRPQRQQKATMCLLHTCHPMDKNPPRTQDFRFYQTLNSCVTCFSTTPSGTSKRPSTLGTKQRHTTGFAARLHT